MVAEMPLRVLRRDGVTNNGNAKMPEHVCMYVCMYVCRYVGMHVRMYV